MDQNRINSDCKFNLVSYINERERETANYQ